MTNLYHVDPRQGAQSVLTHEGAGLGFLALDLLRLQTGQAAEQTLVDEEALLVLLSGSFRLQIFGEPMFEAVIGPRADVFTAKPHAAYIARQSHFCATAMSACEIAVIKAPAEKSLPAQAIKPDDCSYSSSGAFNWRRDIRLLLPPGTPKSQRLIVGETINPPGNWSGIPPHKHDQITANENILEEIYLFKMKPADGFAVQLTYSDGSSSASVVKNDDAYVHHDGYHPTVSAPGVTAYYLWALAGDDKAYKIVTDPRFNWIPQAEAVLKEKANV